MVQAYLTARDPETDYLIRQQRENCTRPQPSDTYQNEVVKINFGPKSALIDVTIRYPIGHENSPSGWYVFACLVDNVGFRDRPESEWFQAAKRALEKFAALKDRTIKLGPVSEAGRPLNMFVELAASVRREETNG